VSTGPSAGPRIGVLALQGDVREHARLLERLGAQVTAVKRPAELAEVDGLVLPGGESMVIDRLARLTGLREPLREANLKTKHEKKPKKQKNTPNKNQLHLQEEPKVEKLSILNSII
jgi:hypothetical protein